MNNTPKHNQNIITRGLPKTGQVKSYRAGDDGDYEAGWWKGRLNSNNKVRFVLKTINGDKVVIDRATGLMWAADGNAAGCDNGATRTWNNAIIYAEGLTFAGYSDWRLPNIFELFNIVDYAVGTARILEPPFSNTGNLHYWVSTTAPYDTIRTYTIYFNNGGRYTKDKSNSWRMRVVRGGL